MNKEIKSIGYINKLSNCYVDEDEVTKKISLLYEEKIHLLKPNKKTIYEIMEYIKTKYTIIENHTTDLDKVSLTIENIGPGRELYELQIQEIKSLKAQLPILANTLLGKKETLIKVDFEVVTDLISVIGSQKLADIICILRGLDELDLNNKYLVVHYLELIDKYGDIAK